MKKFAFNISLLFFLFFSISVVFSQNNNQSNVTAVDPPKEFLKESDPFSIDFYNSDEKVLALEARVKEIRRNLNANLQNSAYDHKTMQDILNKLEVIYEELRRSGKYPFLDKSK